MAATVGLVARPAHNRHIINHLRYPNRRVGSAVGEGRPFGPGFRLATSFSIRGKPLGPPSGFP